jgi:hypothetical protein
MSFDPFQPGSVPRPTTKRRKQVLAAVAASIALVLAAVVAVVVWPSSVESPSQVADRYLRALADGDATTALSLGVATPGSTQLLTDDVLREQLAQLPISNIRVEGERQTPATTDDQVYVEAVAALGDRESRGLIQMHRVDGTWRLASAHITIGDVGDVGRSASTSHTLAVFGQPVGDPTAINMFAGALQLSSTSPFLDVEQSAPFLLDKTLQFGDQRRLLTPVFSLNETGKSAIHDAVVKWITACYTPGLAPAGPCDKIDPTQAGQYAPGARLTGPVDLGQCTYDFNGFLQVVANCHGGNTPFEAQRVDGGVEQRIWTSFTTPVDITNDPPMVVAPQF